MKALITGASSGFGWDMAHILSDMGYDIIAVARRKELLEKLKAELKTDVEVVVCDVSNPEECMSLAGYADKVDILINNAGFGVFGKFVSTSLDDEIKMLDTNVRAVHILTKLFYKRFMERNSGYILNVSSLASFFPGPLFAAYYASKSYVLRLSQSLCEEARRDGKNVSISVLCPGPSHTGFGDVAKVNFGNGSEGKLAKGIFLSSREVSEYAIKKMFKKKTVIVPGAVMRVAAFLRHILPDKLLARAVYTIQSKKVTTKN